MKKIILHLFLMIPMVGIGQKDLKLWYQQPAKTWTEALPVGNGRLGAMIFGKESDELLHLNESTLTMSIPMLQSIYHL
jgi:alpha-L-fucosidase 2